MDLIYVYFNTDSMHQNNSNTQLIRCRKRNELPKRKEHEKGSSRRDKKRLSFPHENFKSRKNLFKQKM